MSREQLDELQSVEIWPCCWESVGIMADVAGQWRMGPAGPTGLDYNVLPFVLEMRHVPQETWPQIFSDLTVMERAALEVFREQQGRAHA